MVLKQISYIYNSNWNYLWWLESLLNEAVEPFFLTEVYLTKHI